MTTPTVTHRDLAQALEVSETTVKSYRTKFPTFLPVARAGKPVRLHPEALDVCRRIRQLFGDGLSVLQASEMLRSEFKEYPLNRRLSTSKASRAGEGPQAGAETNTGTSSTPVQGAASAGVLEDLVRQVHEAQLRAQELAQERIDKLEAEVRNLATMEAASKSLIAELVNELRASRAASAHVSPSPQPPAPEVLSPGPVPSSLSEPAASPVESAGNEVETMVTARKIVTVHDGAGPVASYALGREPRPEPLFRPATPSRDFLDLPAVIRSERGEFLGLPGGQSIARLVEALGGASSDPAATSGPVQGHVPGHVEDQPTWLEDGPDGWICLLPLGRAQTRELAFERTTTPRGNLVGFIRRLRNGDTEASQQELQELFRRLRDQMP